MNEREQSPSLGMRMRLIFSLRQTKMWKTFYLSFQHLLIQSFYLTKNEITAELP